jgi:hypothetical protein
METISQNKRPNTLWPADLMRGNRQKIGTQFIDVYRYFSKRWNGINVQQPTCAMNQGRDFGNGLNCPCFVVRQHDRNQGGWLALKQARESFQIDDSGRSHGSNFDQLTWKASAR